ncbi:hypothetical protein HRG_005044 [Hirsutella rhossiliensis]|uniref:Uncharacterized protein n=1 Tax=Hirsutella rhossiliensis TaxID=111463 RepID=A0A9P8N2A2_9HYPO|nr:uncharacterized protein HRG_05044 [Hirsutella rhossiliensis]KAH0964616.1 hypothetical protein HRG_05044 [Hirsutella rhossiliensis]
MGTLEWTAYSKLKSIYNGGDSKVTAALQKAGSSVPRREAIYRQRHQECKAITEFCQTQVLNASGKDMQAWQKETNLWLGRQSKLEREWNGLVNKLDDLPLPDREKKNGKYVDIHYY